MIQKRDQFVNFNESGLLTNMLSKISGVKATSFTIFQIKVNYPSICKYIKKPFRNSPCAAMSIVENPFISC